MPTPSETPEITAPIGLIAGQQVLFTRQRHDAKRAGLHFDYRIVVGDKAYSWATKKPMPAPGEAIIFHEQPVHTANYALSPEVEIPDGNYGAGKTTLDYVRKAKLGFHSEEGRFTLHMGDDKFLLKKLDPVKYGEKAWLFRNVTPYTEGPESTFTHDGKTWLVDKALDAARGKSIRKAKVSDLDWVLEHTQINRQRLKTANPSIPALVLNDPKHGLVVLDGAHRLAKAKELGWQSIPVRYVEKKELGRAITKKAELDPSLLAKFQPDLTPAQMDALGVLQFKDSPYAKQGLTAKDNYFGVDASMRVWPDKWHNEEHPKGWYEWYQGYHAGKRTDDDERQIKRWISFKARHLAQLQKADPTLVDLSIQPKRRQALLHWAIAPGVDGNVGGQEKKATVNRYLEKIAKAQQQSLGDHQSRALAKLEKTDGVILHHSTGSGKTKTFLVAAQRALEKDKTKRALIVAPASLVSNVDKELEKHKIKLDRKRLDVMSYEMATNRADELDKNKYSIAIADEAQKLRNPGTKRVKSLSEIMSRADKRLLATATANYNHSADIAPLMNIAAGGKILPEDRKEFENRYIRTVKTNPGFIGRLLGHRGEEHQELKNSKELKDILQEHVDYYDSREDPKAADKFPTVTEEAIDVDMSDNQKQMYKFMEGNIPYWARMKIRHNMPMDKKEKAQLNSFSSGVRQVSNGHRHLSRDPDGVAFTPKIERAVSELMKHRSGDKNFRGLVYSNYLDAGVNEYSRKLKEKRVPHSVYTGSLNASQKDELVKSYNTGKVPVLVISSSGAEGLDLKGTKLTQILEPHFNPSKIKQVKGRGARYESHAHLPKEEQTMHVQHFRSVFPKPFFGKAPYSIDKYLSENSDDKDVVFEKIKGLMKSE